MEYGLIKLNNPKVTKTIHIFVNGFMNDEGFPDFNDWVKSLSHFYKKDVSSFFGYHWPSAMNYGDFGNYNPLNKQAWTVQNLANLAFTKLHPIIPVIYFPVRIINSWKEAQFNSIEFGSKLASEIYNLVLNHNNVQIYLYGHSLGCNVIKHTLVSLASSDIKIENIYLFGGASCSYNLKEWNGSLKPLNGVIYNYYSNNDMILKYFYQTVEISKKPIGLQSLDMGVSRKIINYNVSSMIDGHSEYKRNLQDLIKMTTRCIYSK